MISKLWLDVVKTSFYGVKFLSTFFSFSNLVLMEVAHLATSSHEGCSFSYFLAVFQIYVTAAVCSLYWSKEREKTKKRKQDPTYRNSNSEVLLGKGALKICSKFTGKHSCWSVISIKLQSNFIQITLQHRCSPVNLLHIFRTLFLKNTIWGLLLFLSAYFSVDAFGWTDYFSLKSGETLI